MSSKISKLGGYRRKHGGDATLAWLRGERKSKPVSPGEYYTADETRIEAARRLGLKPIAESAQRAGGQRTGVSREGGGRR